MTFDLDRFLTAQASMYEHALQELRAGAKQTHWIWFIFPQLKGLGRSAAAEFYGLDGLAEARVYYAHPVLRARLLECVDSMLMQANAARDVLGEPDDLKFRSCLTLFEAVAPTEPRFPNALSRFFGGPDPATLALLVHA
jgi:uncharacterized protein (DUF1810 family)